METLTEKSKRELRAFAAACEAGLPIAPLDVLAGDRPDLRVSTGTGMIGIEVSEVLPLPRNPSFDSSLAEARVYEDSVRLAEEIYYKDEGATPVNVTTYPWNFERTRKTKREMADALAMFVKAHCYEATPVKLFTRLQGIPEGFGVVNICSVPDHWQASQSLHVTLEGIFSQIADRIASKDALLPTYRANLLNVPIWLLLYSCWEVSRSVPMPGTIHEWACPFRFDRVFFFSSASQSVEEIHRQ